MTLRTFIFTMMVLGFQYSAFSEDEPTTKRHELGVNTTLLIKQVLSFNSNNIPFSPYFVTYKYLFKNNINLRAGAGVMVQKTSTTENDINKRYSKSYNMDYRLGIEKQNMLSERWKAYYGLDIIYTYNEIFAESEFATFSNQVKGFGAGPVVGIQFYMTKRLSLFAESTLYYSNLNDRTSNTSTNPFGQNSTSHSNILKGEIKLPTTLYLAFKL
jgi:hypothetical protein